MAEVPKTTLDDYKDWAKRHDVKLNISDEELQKALDLGNNKAQEMEDQREANRQKHLTDT